MQRTTAAGGHPAQDPAHPRYWRRFAAPWSIPFAKALKTARVTAVDFPRSRRSPANTPSAGASPTGTIEGDFHEADFGTGRFDLAIMGNVLHGEGPDWSKRLLKRTCDALAEGGMLLIGDLIPNHQRSGPAVPLLFGLNMLMNTPEGNVFTMREYRAWLKEAGFERVTTMPAHVSPLILATK